jgi:hypothetical protein
MAKIIRIVTYIFGFAIGVACIIFPFVTHAATNNAVAMAIFGVAVILAMIFVVAWNKAGEYSAGAGTADTGLSSIVKLTDNQWMIVLAIIAGGFILAVVAALVIPH